MTRSSATAAPEPKPRLSIARRWALTIFVAAAALLLLPFSPAWTPLLERAPDPFLARAIRWTPRDPRPHLLLGERRLARGEIRPALEEFERAASLGSQEFRLSVALADAMRAAGLHEKAAAQARELLRIEPESGRLHRILGQCLLERGELSEGLAALEEATRRAPREADAWIALAEARLGIDGFQPRTARVWEEGRRYNPGDPGLRYGLAESDAGLGRYEEAEALLRDLPRETVPEGLKTRELYARAWTTGARRFGGCGPTLHALPWPGRRWSVPSPWRPTSPTPTTNWAFSSRMRATGAARTELSTATRLRPYAHPFWYHLARVDRRLGREREAAQAQARFDTLVSTFDAVNRESQALDAHPEHIARRLRLARLLMARWDWDAAALHLSLVLRDHPGHPEATRLLEQVRAAMGERQGASGG